MNYKELREKQFDSIYKSSLKEKIKTEYLIIGINPLLIVALIIILKSLGA